MAKTLQTDLNKKTQQDNSLLYVPAQTGQIGTGSLVINSSASQPAYGYPVSKQQTSYSKNQNLAAQASPAQASTAGPNINGVSDWSMQGLTQYGQQYAPSQAVTEAKNYLESVMGGQPGGFSSKYAGDIAALYDKIMNRPKFEYDVNRDPLFQQYKNQYTVQGQRAMQDTMGQAAGLTGGYGNSWGTTAGYQAYQYYLQQLNDRIPELEQRAFDRYTAEGDEMRANMNMMTTLDTMDYNRYRDTVSDWQADRNFAANLYANERNWDMGEWNSLRSYYTQLAGMENADYWNGRNLDENARQFDKDLEYRYYGEDKGDAFKYAQLAENARQFDTSFAEDQRLNDRAFDYKKERDLVGDQQWQTEFEENKRVNDRNFERQVARDAVSDEQWQKDYDQTQYWNEKNFANTEARQAEEDRRYWETVDYRNQQDAYNRTRDAREDENWDKLFNQNEQHYQDSLARQDEQTRHQYEREAVEDQRYNDTWQHNLDREAVEDQRYNDTWQHNLDREAVEDARYNDTTAYNRGRDEKQDEWNEKLYNQSEQHYQDSLANDQRTWEHMLEREGIEDARYNDTTAYNRERDAAEDAWNQKLYDQSEQHYQDTRADNQRTWEHMLEREGIEDARYTDETAYNRGRDAVSDSQWQATQNERIREFDLGYGLDKAEFDLKYQQYLDALKQLEGSGSGNGGNGMAISSSDKKQSASDNNSMTALPIMETNIQGGTNYGPLAQSTPAIPAAQAQTLLSQMEELYQKSIQKKNAEQKTAQAKASNEPLQGAAKSDVSALMASSLGQAALQAAKNRAAKKK